MEPRLSVDVEGRSPWWMFGCLPAPVMPGWGLAELCGDRGGRFWGGSWASGQVLVVRGGVGVWWLGVVDDVQQAVVEVGADGVGVGGGVVSLAAQDGDELGAGVVEAAAFADRLEAAVELEWSGAVAVAEEPAVEPVVVAIRIGGGGGWWLVGGLDGAGGVEVLLGDGGVGDACVDEGSGGWAVSEQRGDCFEGHAAVDALGGQGVA